MIMGKYIRLIIVLLTFISVCIISCVDRFRVVAYGSDPARPIFSGREFKSKLPDHKQRKLSKLVVYSLRKQENSNTLIRDDVWGIKCGDIRLESVTFGNVPGQCVEATPIVPLKARTIYTVQWIYPGGPSGEALFYIDDINESTRIINIDSYTLSISNILHNYYITESNGKYSAQDLDISIHEINKRINNDSIYIINGL